MCSRLTVAPKRPYPLSPLRALVSRKYSNTHHHVAFRTTVCVDSRYFNIPVPFNPTTLSGVSGTLRSGHAGSCSKTGSAAFTLIRTPSNRNQSWHFPQCPCRKQKLACLGSSHLVTVSNQAAGLGSASLGTCVAHPDTLFQAAGSELSGFLSARMSR